MPRYKIKIRHHFKKLVSGELVLPSAGIYLLKGPVGSGKTSILRELYFHKNHKHTFSYQTLDFPFAAGITVKEHIELVKNSTSIDEVKLEKLLMKFNIYNLLENEIAKLSDGEKERLLISLALAERTPVALLDEPSARLDRLSIARLLKILEEEKKERLIIISTHRDDFESLTSGTYHIQDKVLVKPMGEVVEGQSRSNKRPHFKKRYPKSRLIQGVMLVIVIILSAISLSTLIPSMEYLSPTSKNFYHGPKDSSPTRYIKKICRNCNMDPLYNLDFYAIPSRLSFVYNNEYFHFSINEFNNYREIISFNKNYYTNYVYVESVNKMNFAISRGLYNLFKLIYLNFDNELLSLGGLSNPSVFEDDGVYIKYPETMIHTLAFMFKSVGEERYISPEDKFFDYQLKPRSLMEDQVAYNLSYYFENDFGGPNNPNEEGKKAIYFRGPIGLKRIINKTYDYHYDQFDIYNSAHAIYSRSKSPNKVFSNFYDSIDTFKLERQEYLKFIELTNLNLSYWISVPVIFLSMLVIGFCQILESLLLRSKRNLFLYYNSAIASLPGNLSYFDHFIYLFLIPVLFISIPLFIPFIFPSINYFLGLSIIVCLAIFLSLTKLLISFFLNQMIRNRLR